MLKRHETSLIQNFRVIVATDKNCILRQIGLKRQPQYFIQNGLPKQQKVVEKELIIWNGLV